MIGRLGAALDEVGVLVETGCEVVSVNSGKVALKDGREVECDAIILHAEQAAKVLEKVDEEIYSSNFANSPKFAASIEAGLSSKPMAESTV